MSNVTGQWVSVKKGGSPKLLSVATATKYQRVYCMFISADTGGVYFGYLQYAHRGFLTVGQAPLVSDYAPHSWVSTKQGGEIVCRSGEVLAWYIMPETPKLTWVDEGEDSHYALLDDLTDDAAEVKLPE